MGLPSPPPYTHMQSDFRPPPPSLTPQVMPGDWSVRSLLDHIATARPAFNALIDTGALITGMSNKQVAAYLLQAGLPDISGVVFLDELDRKVVLLRPSSHAAPATKVIKLTQCGISKQRLFSFYDQVCAGCVTKWVLGECPCVCWVCGHVSARRVPSCVLGVCPCVCVCVSRCVPCA